MRPGISISAASRARGGPSLPPRRRLPEEGPAASFERPPAPVSVAAAAVRDVPVYLDEIGKCVAREVVSVQPQVGGRIAEIHFEDGADLKKGDLLFTIDPEPYRAAVASAEANLARAKAVLDLARVDFARIAESRRNEDRRAAGLRLEEERGPGGARRR